MTGNVNFVGSVKIRGNVCAGMKIKSGGSVEVNGTVEAASIEAEGDVIINGGIKGMNKAIISSKGNVISRYIEQAYIKCKGMMTTNSIIQCRIECDDKINATGSNGSIIGGNVKSAKAIICKKLGSHTYIPTYVEVGMSSVHKENKEKIEKEIAAIRKELAKMNAVIESGFKPITISQANALKQIAATKPEKEKRLMELETEYDTLCEAIKDNTLAAITAIDAAYPEVTVSINGMKMVLKTEYKSTTFYISGGEVFPKKCEVLDF
jgi:uncharacterized protein (DUF342 family)